MEPVAKKLTEELSQKLTATDAVLKDSVKQLVRSKVSILRLLLSSVCMYPVIIQAVQARKPLGVPRPEMSFVAISGALASRTGYGTQNVPVMCSLLLEIGGFFSRIAFLFDFRGCDSAGSESVVWSASFPSDDDRSDRQGCL